jgi:3-hydroxyisobutyrate dehydrogenase-like beta-hydroxyacid dehydrogenase
MKTIALVGYGEVGSIFGAALGPKVEAIRAYDIRTTDAMRARAARDGITLCASVAEAAQGADLVISAVTASATRDAAQSIAAAVARGSYMLDINSASPKVKVQCGALLDEAGGRYVESAVMTSVPPYGIAVPMLLGGAHAEAAIGALTKLGFKARVASRELGVASAIKMCRSVMIKGMEAIVIESFLAARRYGVEREVLDSLAETFPAIDWEKQGRYFWSRVARHGKRRAEEMREAAATVREIGLEPLMASAIAERQQWVADLAQEGTFEGVGEKDWRDYADRTRG